MEHAKKQAKIEEHTSHLSIADMHSRMNLTSRKEWCKLKTNATGH
jgi:hypothetical protein